MHNLNLFYRQIVRSIIAKSFPDLKEHKIFVFEIPKYFWATAVCCYFFLFSVICPTRKARKLNKKSIRGLLVHEISHLSMNRQKPFWKMIYDGIMYYLSKETYARIENETDKFVIEKGYARDFFEAVRNLEKIRTKKELKKRQDRGYLSSEEIKNYAKSIRKW